MRCHLHVAAIIAAFIFTAIVSDGPCKLYQGSETKQQASELFRASEMQMNILDQVRIGLLCTSLMMELMVVFQCLVLHEFMTVRCCRKFHRPWTGALNNLCVTMLMGIVLWVFTVPFTVLKYFGFSVVFFYTCLIPLYFTYKVFHNVGIFVQLWALLANLELGRYWIDPYWAKVSGMKNSFVPVDMQLEREKKQMGKEWWTKNGFSQGCGGDGLNFYDAVEEEQQEN